jgi:hypothetical protein
MADLPYQSLGLFPLARFSPTMPFLWAGVFCSYFHSLSLADLGRSPSSIVIPGLVRSSDAFLLFAPEDGAMLWIGKTHD